jgi:hypothetical protein
VGSLLAAGFDQVSFPQHRQHLFKQHRFRLALNQSGPKLAQNQEIKARIG